MPGENDPIFSPSDVEKHTGVDTETQRDWRRRGLLEGYGRNLASGRWHYSFADIVAVYTARRLITGGMRRQDATATAAAHAPTVITFMQAREVPYRFVLHYFTWPDGVPTLAGLPKPAGLPTPDDVTESKFQTRLVFNFPESSEALFDRMEVINLRRIADSAPPHLRAMAQDFLEPAA